MTGNASNTTLRQMQRLFATQEAEHLADRHLVRRFLDHRDEAAFAALAHRHGPMVLGVCRSVLRNAADAQDAFQATFVVFARRASAIRRQDSIASWLHGVAYRVALKARVLAGKRRTRDVNLLRQSRPTIDLTGPLDELTWRELREIIHDELSRLADRHRLPLVLCYLEGKTVDEAARQLGWPSTTVKGRLDQARKQLRSRLTRRGLELSAPLFATLLSQHETAATPIAAATAACPYASGQAVSAIAPHVLVLAKGVMQTMFWTKLKLAASAAVAATLLITATGVAIAWNQASPPREKSVLEKPTPPPVPPGVQVAADDKAPKKDEPAGPKNVSVTGTVVDDETGSPIPFFIVQGGHFDKKTGKLTWGYTLSRSSRPDPQGKLSAQIGWGDGWRSRVIAPGYMPQPILEKPPTQEKMEITLRMKKGRQVTGTVLDHADKPVPGISVFVVGGRPVNIANGLAINRTGNDDEEDATVTKVLTDERGFFTIAGIGEDLNRIAVSGPTIDLWVAPIPEKDNDFTVRLPQAGKLTIKYDIEGASADAKVLLQMETYNMPGWEQVESLLSPKLKPKGQIVFSNLPPGKYQLTRQKNVRVGGMGFGSLLDRRVVTIKPGETVASDFIRDKGSVITGQVLGLDKHGIADGAFIKVKPASATGDYRRVEEGMLSYDATSCNQDGKFTTERLAPGEYTVTAQAYLPEDPMGRARLGMRAPAFTGTVKVTVPETGNVPPIQIELKKVQ